MTEPDWKPVKQGNTNATVCLTLAHAQSIWSELRLTIPEHDFVVSSLAAAIARSDQSGRGIDATVAELMGLAWRLAPAQELEAALRAALTARVPCPHITECEGCPKVAVGEPVAWAVFHRDGTIYCAVTSEASGLDLADKRNGETVRPLYASPPAPAAAEPEASADFPSVQEAKIAMRARSGPAPAAAPDAAPAPAGGELDAAVGKAWDRFNAKLSELTVGDLTALVQRLARALKKAEPDNELPAAALGYLRREHLIGSPLRESPPTAQVQADAPWSAELSALAGQVATRIKSLNASRVQADAGAVTGGGEPPRLTDSQMTDRAMDDEDLRCPICRCLATRTLSFGWIFRCEPCNRDWGHPQGMPRQEAAEALFDAKEAAAKDAA